MPFHDPPADGQPDARARVLTPGVKSLKDHEDALEVFRRDADAVVPDGEHAFRRARLRADMDLGSLAAAELDGVADEVLQQLDELSLVGHDSGQFVARHQGARLPDGNAQIRPHGAQHSVDVYRLHRLSPGADARELQEVVDESLHPNRAVHREVDERASLVVELFTVATLEQLRVARDHAERFLQIVRRYVRELLQLLVAALQLSDELHAGPVLVFNATQHLVEGIG